MEMEIIAMGELHEFLQNNLPKFEDPVIFISSDYIPGCPKCNSSTNVYYITLTERSLIPSDRHEKALQSEMELSQKYPHNRIIYISFGSSLGGLTLEKYDENKIMVFGSVLKSTTLSPCFSQRSVR